MIVKRRTKSVEKASETAMNPGDVDVGSVMKRGVPSGKAERSARCTCIQRANTLICMSDAAVQLNGASLFGREHEPSAPNRIVVPSTSDDRPGCVSSVDGDTTRSATWPVSITTGARYAKRVRRRAVRESRGAR